MKRVLSAIASLLFVSSAHSAEFPHARSPTASYLSAGLFATPAEALTHRGAGSCWTTGANGFTVKCSTPITSGTCAGGDANGTCFTAVAASGNDGTCAPQSTEAAAQASPCLTISVGIGKTRTGSADWLELKKGDTWTDQVFGNIKRNGLSATQPWVVTSYGTGARPLIKTNPSLGESGCAGTGAGGGGLGQGNYIAFMDVECYNYTRDPANIGSTFNPGNGSQNCTYFSNAFNWHLEENIKCSFYDVGLAMDADQNNNAQLFNTYIRRNIIVNSYTPSIGGSGHSQGVHALGHFGTFLFEENLFDTAGWNPTLIAPITATMTIASPSVITASFGYTVIAGMGMTFHANGDTLPTGFAVQTCYYVVNVGAGGANTFELAATVGGTAINTSGSQSGTHQIAWDCPGASPQATIFNHCLYIDSQNAAVTLHGNIITNCSDVSIQARNGGTLYNNLFSNSPEGGFAAGVNSSIHDNVWAGMAGHNCNNGMSGCPSANNGPVLNSGANGSMTNNLVINAGTGSTGATALAAQDSNDDCGRITTTLANPAVVSWTVFGVANGLVTGFQNTCGGTLPAHISADTNYWVSSASISPAGGSSGNISATSGGALISTQGDTQSGNFKPAFYAYNDTITGNTIYNFGNATGNANLSNSVQNPGTNTISGNTNFNSGGGAFPDNTRTIATYDSVVLGGPGTLADFIAKAAGQSRDNWNTNYTAKAAAVWIGVGFGVTIN